MTTWIGTPFSTQTNTAPTTQQVSDFMKAFYDACIGVGLIQTADTGQLDPLNPPAWPGSQGFQSQYLIFRMDDSQQATDPIFLKVQFGRSGTPNGGVSIQVTIGQGSNGAGTLTGTTGVISADGGGNSTSGTPTVQTYMCAGEGYWFWAEAVGWTNGMVARTFGGLNRTRNPSTYAFDGQGVIGFANTTIQSPWTYRFLTMAPIKWGGGLPAASVGHNYCVVPGQPASTALLNGDKQLYPHFYTWPDVRQNWATFTARQSEVGGTNPTTFSARPLLSGPSRTFINWGANGLGNPSGSVNMTDTTWAFHHIWE